MTNSYEWMIKENVFWRDGIPEYGREWRGPYALLALELGETVSRATFDENGLYTEGKLIHLTARIAPLVAVCPCGAHPVRSDGYCSDACEQDALDFTEGDWQHDEAREREEWPDH